MQNKKITGLLVFLFFLSVYMLMGNGKLTTSMDVDAIRYAEEFVQSGDYGSPFKLAGGIAYSTKTGLFYPLEGVGVTTPLIIAKYISNIISPESDYVLYMTGQVLTALTMLFVYLIFNSFVSHKKAFLYTTILGLATPVLVHSKLLMPEPVTMLLFIASIWSFVQYFYQKSSEKYLLLSGLFTGLVLFCRPDAPIFFLLFSALLFTKLFLSYKDQFVKKAVWLGLGLIISVSLFVINNYQMYGKPFEVGYTIDKENAKQVLDTDLKNMEPEMQKVYNEANALYTNDQNSAETQAKVKEFTDLQQEFESKQSYRKDLDVQTQATDVKKDNPIITFFYGVYLIFINPNRAIFFLSPVLLFLLLPLLYLYKNYRVETIFCALIFVAYLTLYALRAPQSYAGSAAWGIRYLLPALMVFGLTFIGLDKVPFYQKKEKFLSKLLFGLAGISFIFQIIGSSVNYQAVQMPLEYACKQKYGEADKKWAYESRNQLMTGFSGSLLVNNWQILRGKTPAVLKNNLPPETITMIENSNQLESGANDWLFYDVIVKKQTQIKGADTSNLGALFFVLLITALGSLYLLVINKDDKIRKTT